MCRGWMTSSPDRCDAFTSLSAGDSTGPSDASQWRLDGTRLGASGATPVLERYLRSRAISRSDVSCHRSGVMAWGLRLDATAKNRRRKVPAFN